MKLPKFLKSKERRLLEKIETEFNEGKINLPTDVRDYENIEELKSKSPEIVKNRLDKIQNG